MARRCSGPDDLRAALAARRDQFVQTVTEKLMTYALGRHIDYRDMPTVRDIVRNAAKRQLPLRVHRAGRRQERCVPPARAAVPARREGDHRRRSLRPLSSRLETKSCSSPRSIFPAAPCCKGAGATIALPLLDAMIPAGTALAQTPPRRQAAPGLRVLPARRRARSSGSRQGTGTDFEFSPHPEAARSAARLRHRGQRPAQQGRRAAESAARHHRRDLAHLPGSAGAMPGARRSASRSTRSPRKQIGQDTPLPSLELCAEPGGAISYRDAEPAAADGRQSAQGVLRHVRPGRLQRRPRRASARPPTACSTTCRNPAASLNRKLDAADRALVSDYLESVREVEGRVQKLMAKADSLGDLPDAPLRHAG